MTFDPEEIADVLRRLSLGELAESDEEARRILDACEEARAEWRELSRAIQQLEQAGGDEETVSLTARLEITEEDRQRVRAFFLPRLREVRPQGRPWSERLALPRLTWMAPALACACALVLWMLGPFRGAPAPDPGTHPGLMGDGPGALWAADRGLTLTSEVGADGVVHLRWQHTAEKPRIPGTVYRVELVAPDGTALLEQGGLVEPTWSPPLEALRGDRIRWRVHAESEGDDYARGNDVVVLPD